jgi:hypothetical protein
VHRELALGDAAPKLGGEHQPARRVVVDLGPVALDPGLRGLGDVHRDVGALQQRATSSPSFGHIAMPMLARTSIRS